MLHLVLAGITLVCALQVMHAKQLLSSALWLAGASAGTAALMYLLGAYQVAVVELSVGAGLVTVLFVFAISIAGESTFDPSSIVPKPLAWFFVGSAALLIGWLTLNTQPAAQPQALETGFTQMLWQGRALDVLVQIVLIFAGVVGMLGLLVDVEEPVKQQEWQPQRRETPHIKLEAKPAKGLQPANIKETQP
ncbi:MAG: hypothetical protein OHK0052_04620 [Anaerolineales bacterium]